MERLLNVAEMFDRPSRAIGKMGSWFILPLIGIIMFDVITRKIDYFRIALAEANIAWFNPNIFQDSEWHLHAILAVHVIWLRLFDEFPCAGRHFSRIAG